MTEAARPIFLLGIFERSGTNYLWDLLRVHPDIGVRRPIWEDNVLRFASSLERYVYEVVESWDPRWNVPSHERGRLTRSLGQGLETFLTLDATAPHVVVKTPTVDNLHLFAELFPAAPLIVLIRDGRSVTESSVRSFGRSYPVTMKQWAQAGQRVIDALERRDAGLQSFQLVRYEDLLVDLRAEMTRLLEFCKLDVSAYDFDKAEQAPIRGSSTTRPDEGGPVAWKRVERTSDFQPLERHADWEPALRHLYAELAGEVATALGYDVGELPPLDNSTRMRLVAYRAELASELGRRSARRWSDRFRRATKVRRRR